MKNIKEIIHQSGIKFGTSGARGLVIDFTQEVCIAFTVSFLDVMKKSKCLACDTHLVIGNEQYISQISETVKGAKITCKKCNQKYFLHVLVSMTPNPNH